MGLRTFASRTFAPWTFGATTFRGESATAVFGTLFARKWDAYRSGAFANASHNNGHALAADSYENHAAAAAIYGYRRT